MQDLQFSLIVLGGFAILGVLVHGLWTIRNNNKDQEASSEPEETFAQESEYPLDTEGVDCDENNFSEPSFSDPIVSAPAFDEPTVSEPTFNQQKNTALESEVAEPVEKELDSQDDYDELGIGKVRVVDVEPKRPEPALGDIDNGHGTANDDDEEVMPEPPVSLMKEAGDEVQSTTRNKEEKEKSRVDMYPSPVTHNKADSGKIEPKVTESKSNTDPTPVSTKRQEPQINEEQMKIDFEDEIKLVAQDRPKPTQSKEPLAPQQQEVLVLNVKSPEDKPIAGAALLPMLLTLGFKFGDQDIFHRHVNSNGKGPVLFSLANMFKPGNFDIDNLETFNTLGISLFMMLPIDGDPHQVFNMMHNAARKIADEFGAQVMDGRRSLLTRQSLQQYVEKIREFERQRMLRK